MRTNKRKLQEEQEIKEEKKELPCIQFCIDNIVTSINTNQISDYLEAFENEKNITYCFCNILHNPNYFKFPFSLHCKQALEFFINVLNDKNPQIDIDVELNFLEFKLLCDYFHANLQIVCTIQNQILQLVIISHPLTIVTAWQYINKHHTKKEKPIKNLQLLTIDYEKILAYNQIPLKKKLKFLTNHNLGDKLSLDNIISHQYVSESLQIPIALLGFLNEEDAIIAGGASMYLGCPWSQFTMKSDVDIFVLNSSTKFSVLTSICNFLKREGYVLFQLGKSVITCLNEYGKRIIQLILTPYSNPIDVILNFDLMPIKCFYNGQKLCKLIQTHYDWCTKKISKRALCELKPMRLFNLFNKGFALEEEYILYLQSTIGWPLSENKKNQFLYDIPYINKSIPMEVNVALMKKRGLTLMEDVSNMKTFVLDISPYVGKYNACFNGNYRDCLPQITFGLDHIFKKFDYYFCNVECPYSFKVNNVSFLFILKNSFNMVMDVSNNMSQFENDIITKFLTLKPSTQKRLMGKEVNQIRCKAFDNCQLFKNGIPFSLEKKSTFFEHASINVTPMYLYYENEYPEYRICWKLNAVFS